MTQHKGSSRRKVSEGKSLSSILMTVSRTERVSDSPCQGRATKVNSQVYDLMSSRPPDSRSVPLSVREATNLETTLRGSNGVLQFPIVDRHCPLSLPWRFGLLPHGRPPARPVPAILLKGGRECRWHHPSPWCPQKEGNPS